MNKQSKKVELCVIQHAALKNNRASLLPTEIPKRHLNSHICQHYGMKTSTVTTSFYYVSACTVMIPYQVSSEIYGGFFDQGITLKCK